MAEPLIPTTDVFDRDDRVRKIEFLPIPNITADFQVNLNTELLLTSFTDLWDQAMGLIREEGFRKKFRSAVQGKPADGKITVIGAGLINDGETFTISDGITEVIFEFDTVPDGAGLNVAVDISLSATIEDVRIAVEDAINGSALLMLAEPTRTLSPALANIGTGGEIDLSTTDIPASTAAAEAQNIRITDTVADERFTHRGMSGAVYVQAVGRINVPDPSLLIDGESFTIPGAGNPDERFEFDDDNSPPPGDNVIDLSGFTSPPPLHDTQMETRIVTAINTKTGTTGIVASSDPIAATGTLKVTEPGNLVDGETFTLDDGVNTPTTFEFDTDATWTSPNVPIDISGAIDFRDVRTAVLAAINGVATLDITAFTPGFGDTLNLTNDTPGSAGNTTSISLIVSNKFSLSNMTGGKASVKLIQNTGGTIFNETITETVAELTFEVSGMLGGSDAGWDVTSGIA